MNDGGEAEGKKDEQDKAITRSDSSDYGRAIARVAVAQLCQSIGFEAFNESSLDSLTDIAIRYIGDLGLTSKYYSNIAGRTESNVFDVVQGLQDLGLSQGFQAASEIHTRCILSSGIVREIKEYVESAEEIPFAHQLSQFPVIRGSKLIPSFLQMGETAGFRHVPDWLPAFPDPHTYMRTLVWNERVSDPRTDQIQLAKQHRKAERSLLNLQQRLLSNGLQTSAEPDSSGSTEGRNPFLPKPEGDGESEILVANLPPAISGKKHEEKHVSVLETFAPAIEAMRDGLDSVSDGEKIIVNKRASAFLELRSSRKVFGEPLDLRIRSKARGKPETWFGREDENDKKRRVEFILRQSRENQQELPQL